MYTMGYKTFDELQVALDYSSGFGNTVSLIHCVKNTNAVLVVHSQQYRKYLLSKYEFRSPDEHKKITTLYNIIRGDYRGIRLPFVFDNAVMHAIVSEHNQDLNTINTLLQGTAAKNRWLEHVVNDQRQEILSLNVYKSIVKINDKNRKRKIRRIP
jgi:hypothetical protein